MIGVIVIHILTMIFPVARGGQEEVAGGCRGEGEERASHHQAGPGDHRRRQGGGPAGVGGENL